MAQGLEPISTITGKPQPSFDDKVRVAQGLGRVAEAYNPITQLKNLDDTLGGIRRGEIAYNDPRAVGAAFELAMAPMFMPGGGGGVANIGRKEGLKKLAFGRRNLMKDAAAPDEIVSWELEKMDKLINHQRELAQSAKKNNQPFDHSTLKRYEHYRKSVDEVSKISTEHKRNVADRITKSSLHEQALGMSRTPQQLLDPITDVKYGRRADFDSPTIGAHVDRSGIVEVSPLNTMQRTFGHEGTHLKEKQLASANRLVENPNMPPIEKYRMYRAKQSQNILNKTQDFDTPEQARAWYKEKYDLLPSELHAEAISKWGLDFKVKNKRNPTDAEFYKVWDREADKILKDLSKKAPDLAQIGRDQTAYFAMKHDLKEYMGGGKSYDPYGKAPDSLMGFPKDPSRAHGGYDSHPGYKKEIEVRVRIPGKAGTMFPEDVFYDGIKGLNKAHALERARRNWPNADVKIVNPKTDLPEMFKTTQQAVEFGTIATPTQLKKLEISLERSKKQQEFFKERAKKDPIGMQDWMDEATRGQYYREALEGAKGIHPSQRKK